MLNEGSSNYKSRGKLIVENRFRRRSFFYPRAEQFILTAAGFALAFAAYLSYSNKDYGLSLLILLGSIFAIGTGIYVFQRMPQEIVLSNEGIKLNSSFYTWSKVGRISISTSAIIIVLPDSTIEIYVRSYINPIELLNSMEQLSLNAGVIVEKS